MKTPTISDPELGELTFSHGTWKVEQAGDRVPLFIRAGARGPDAELRAAAIAARRDAAELEARAREYLASADVEQPWSALTLAAIGVFRPGAGWLGRKATDPVVSLEFAIDRDRNVVDVAFIDGEPVDWDYH